MAAERWKQHAKLRRLPNGMAFVPDPPIWTDTAVVGTGTLGPMVTQWAALPQSHKPHHVIEISGGALNFETIQGLAEQPRYEEE